jgi:hypothetical protein
MNYLELRIKNFAVMFKQKNRSIKTILNRNKSMKQKIKIKAIELLAASTRLD